MNTAFLLTENGTLLKGKSFGAQGTSLGELCFNTGMTGYQEVFSDPSYYGQTIIMTSPHIGNYGNHEKEFQSKGFQAAGLVCGFIADVASRKGSDVQHLDDRLKESGIVGIQGLDTRQLVQEVRDKGAVNVVISTEAIEYRHGNAPNGTINMPTILKYADVTLKKGVFSSDNEFQNWIDSLKMNTVKRLSVKIKLLNENGDPEKTWILKNAFPIQVTPTDMNSTASEVAVETIVFAHEGLEVIV